jgi:hypothetical protein
MLHSGLTRTHWASLKMIASDTHSSLLVQRALDEEKKFYYIDTSSSKCGRGKIPIRLAY